MKTAIILAGGKGTRLGENLPPKGMLEINGKTLLQRQLDWLHSEKFEKVILGLGHRADEVKYNNPGMQIITVIEKEPLGTAGAVKKAYKDNKLEEPVYVFNVDDYVAVETDKVYQQLSLPIVVAKALPFSIIDPNGTFHKQNMCGTHIGHHLLRKEDIEALPDKGDLPTWLSQRKVGVHMTDKDWVTVNTPEQLEEIRKKVR